MPGDLATWRPSQGKAELAIRFAMLSLLCQCANVIPRKECGAYFMMYFQQSYFTYVSI